MSFRDDHDAALARASALAEEVERLRQERDALAEKAKERDALAERVADLEAEVRRTPEPNEHSKSEATEPAKDLDPESRRHLRRLSRISGAVVGLVGLGFVIFVAATITRSCLHLRNWEARTAERSAYQDRWFALTSVEPCLRKIAAAALEIRAAIPGEATGPIRYVSPSLDSVIDDCTHGAARLAEDPGTSDPLRSALVEWLAIQDELVAPVRALRAYYANEDWKEDNYAGAQTLWAPVSALLQRQPRAFARVHRVAVPLIVAELRVLQRAHEVRSGRDVVWWRVELALRLRAINDRAYEAAGIYDGREEDAGAAALAIRRPIIELLELAKNAPIEVRRILRKLDSITAPIAAGMPLDAQMLRSLAETDQELIGKHNRNSIPAIPPDPGPRPGPKDDDDD